MKTACTRRRMIKRLIAGSAAAIAFPSTGLSAMAPDSNTDNDGKNFTFLFQGDSITDGNRSRNNDWNHVMGHGYAYLIASRLWYDHPDKAFHFFNRGVSGNTVSDLTDRWQSDSLDLKPDLISILVGVNDVNRLFDKTNPSNDNAASFQANYTSLVSLTKLKLPSTRIILCEPFLLPVGKVKDNWAAWSSEMKTRQAAIRSIAALTDSIFVPLQDAFDKALDKAPADYWIWDGIHPMPAGHELIARRWLRTVQKELHFIR